MVEFFVFMSKCCNNIILKNIYHLNKKLIRYIINLMIFLVKKANV